MPVTPLHFGLGILGKGTFPRRVSLTAFVVSQIAIDGEVAYYMLVRHAYPFHRWAHTFVGGALIGVLSGAGVVLAARVLAEVAGATWEVPDLREGSWAPAAVGGLLGSLTHPVLDGIMHDDIQPLRPFSGADPFHQLVSVTVLQWSLVAMGVVGALLLTLTVRRLLSRASEG